ncbi:zinc ABC transporter substrate-binding protein [Yimella sp. cx-573]|nr:zinc ABC transporter substrate-binding protein [Yimella sp. cx-573]
MVLMNRAAPFSFLVAGALLTGCGSSGDSSKTAADGTTKLKVVTSFYPLQYAAQRVGGDHVEVSSLTSPGAEPHDLELTPKQAAQVQDAQLMVYLKGFQPSVDAAAKSSTGAFDVSTQADLSLKADDSASVDGHDGHDHEGHDHEGHDHGSADPHFWLDPVRYSKVVGALAEQLAGKDPKHAAGYRAAAKKFVGELGTLDTDFTTTLKTCQSKDLVTGHTAFGYLAARYGFKQVGVSSISPDQEPTPGRLKSVADFVKKNKVTTIYTETLASPAVAQTVARQTGAKVAVLDPLEGLTDKSAGRDYLSVMRANLGTLKQGQTCR